MVDGAAVCRVAKRGAQGRNTVGTAGLADMAIVGGTGMGRHRMGNRVRP